MYDHALVAASEPRLHYINVYVSSARILVHYPFSVKDYDDS